MSVNQNGRNVAPKNIFISYRVSDTAGETGRLVDSLKQAFEEDQIFMDIDKLEPGVDFTKVISKSLESCDVMLAIMGPNWIGAKNASGVSRINQPHDWVRLELSTALQRDIRVVPVLVNNASLPDETELPEDLQSLLRRQTHEISNTRWRYDSEQLIAFLESIGFRRKSKPGPPPPVNQGMPGWLKGVIAVGVLALLLLVGVLAVQSGKDDTQKGVPKNEPPVNVVNEPKKEEPNPEPTPVQANEVIGGNWNDASGAFYTMITQSGDNIELQTYSKINGQNSGSGSGTIEGNKLSFSIQFFYPQVLITGKGIVDRDGNRITGTASLSGNGTSYNEAFTWTKQ